MHINPIQFSAKRLVADQVGVDLVKVDLVCTPPWD